MKLLRTLPLAFLRRLFHEAYHSALTLFNDEACASLVFASLPVLLSLAFIVWGAVALASPAVWAFVSSARWFVVGAAMFLKLWCTRRVYTVTLVIALPP